MIQDNKETKYVLECNLKEFRDYVVQVKGKLFAKNHFYIFKDKSYKLMETELLNKNTGSMKMYFRYFLKDGEPSLLEVQKREFDKLLKQDVYIDYETKSYLGERDIVFTEININSPKKYKLYLASPLDRFGFTPNSEMEEIGTVLHELNIDYIPMNKTLSELIEDKVNHK